MQEMQETRVWSKGREDPLEQDIATHSSILAWESPWIEELDGLQSVVSQKVGHDWVAEWLTDWLKLIKQELHSPHCTNEETEASEII